MKPANKYVDAINFIAESVKPKDLATVSLISDIKKLKHISSIPSWYLVAMKALCEMEKSNLMDGYEIPKEISGIPVQFAKNTNELKARFGLKYIMYESLFGNEENFVTYSAKDFEREAQSKPGMVVVYRNYYYFISELVLEILNGPDACIEETEDENPVELVEN